MTLIGAGTWRGVKKALDINVLVRLLLADDAVQLAQLKALRKCSTV